MCKKERWIPLTDTLYFQINAELCYLKKGEWILSNNSYFYLVDEGLIAWTHEKIKQDLTIYLGEGSCFYTQGNCQAIESTVLWRLLDAPEFNTIPNIQHLIRFSAERIHYWSKFLRLRDPQHFVVQWLLRRTQAKKNFQKLIPLNKIELQKAAEKMNIKLRSLNHIFHLLKTKNVIVASCNKELLVDVVELYFFVEELMKRVIKLDPPR